MSLDSAAVDFDVTTLCYDSAGLLPVVAQDAFTGRVLMLAWANREAVARTLATGEAHFWSRSRRALWRKGESSGNLLRVVSVERDCDGDSLLLRVLPEGAACHTGATSCFDGEGESISGLDLGAIERIVAARAEADPRTSYTARLLAEGIERMAQKVGEEATEVVIAALATRHARDSESEKTGKGKQQENQRLVEEASDLLFHLTVLLRASGVTATDLARELSARHERQVRTADDGSVPLPKSSADVTAVPPEQSERTGPRPNGKRRP